MAMKPSLFEKLRKIINKSGIPTYDDPAVAKMVGTKPYKAGLELPELERYGYDPANPGASEISEGFMFRTVPGGSSNIHINSDADHKVWGLSDENGNSLVDIPYDDVDALGNAIVEQANKLYPNQVNRASQSVSNRVNSDVERWIDWKYGKTDEEMLNEPWNKDPYLQKRILNLMSKRDKQMKAINDNGMMPYGPYRNELKYKKIYRTK